MYIFPIKFTYCTRIRMRMHTCAAWHAHAWSWAHRAWAADMYKWFEVDRDVQISIVCACIRYTHTCMYTHILLQTYTHHKMVAIPWVINHDRCIAIALAAVYTYACAIASITIVFTSLLTHPYASRLQAIQRVNSSRRLRSRSCRRYTIYAIAIMTQVYHDQKFLLKKTHTRFLQKDRRTLWNWLPPHICTNSFQCVRMQASSSVRSLA